MIEVIPFPLVKFCSDQFNIFKTCNTLKLGTLFEYRDIEEVKLRDEGEGKFTHKLTFPDGMQVDQQWLDALFPSFGERMELSETTISDGKVSLSSFDVLGSVANRWIFCMSTEVNGVADSIGETHNSNWMIDRRTADNFGFHVAKMLSDSLSPADFPEEVLEKVTLNGLLKNISVNVNHGEVQYKERELIRHFEKTPDISELKAIQEQAVFQKPTSFRGEKEYRFSFTLTYKGQEISIPNKAKFLQLKPITEYRYKMPG